MFEIKNHSSISFKRLPKDANLGLFNSIMCVIDIDQNLFPIQSFKLSTNYYNALRSSLVSLDRLLDEISKPTEIQA